MHDAKLTEGPIGPTLIRLSAPMLMGIMSMMLFNLVDTYFIAKLGVLPLAAITMTFPVVMLVSTFALGLGVGTVAVVSQAAGRQDTMLVRRLTTDSLTFAVGIVAILILIGLATLEPIFLFMGATPEMLPLVKEYMLIWYPGMLCVVVPMVGSSAIRATGDTLTPGIIMLISAAINAILDPFLIFGIGPFPRLEMGGAALATVISRSISLVLTLSILKWRENLLVNPFAHYKVLLASWKQILYVGLPVAASNAVFPITMAAITRIIAPLGAEAVAGFGIGFRIEGAVFTVMFAMSVGLGPFIGQNIGAQLTDRVRAAVRFSIRFALWWGAIMAILLTITAEPLARLFTTNVSVVTVAANYLWIVPFSYAARCVHQFVWASLNAMGRPFTSAALEVLLGFMLTIPLCYAGALSGQASGIFMGKSVANVVAGIAAYIVIVHVLKQLTKTETRGVSPDPS